MAYPNDIRTYTTKIDKSASGWAITDEFFNVPSSAPYEMYLDHVPKDTASTIISASGGSAWTEVLVTPTAASTFWVNYTTGLVTFYSGDAGAAVDADYESLGDDVMAAHVNNLQTDITNIQNELGLQPAGIFTDITARLASIAGGGVTLASGISGDLLTDDTVRAGALMDDIKGSNWVSKERKTLEDIYDHENIAVSGHAASAIAVVSPGSTTNVNVQQHVESGGAATKTDTNPHGYTLADFGTTNDIDIQADFIGQNVYGLSVEASGGAMSLYNKDNTGVVERSSSINFYEDGSYTGEYFSWNDGGDTFELTDSITIHGNITASGNILSDASGTRDVGSSTNAWDEGIFDNVSPSASGWGRVGTPETAWASGSFQTLRVDNAILNNVNGVQSHGTYGNLIVQVYDDDTRPAPDIAGMVIFNVSDNSLNVCDGAGWRDMDGALT